MSKFEHDVSREQKAILLWMPHMVGLAFMLQHKKAGAHRAAQIANDPGMIACTDGTTVWYGKKYEEIEQSGRNYIFLHEMMHGIFRHPTRTKLLLLQKGVIIQPLPNYAADAIINEAINEETMAKTNQIAMPKDFPGITMKTIHGIIKEAIDFTGEKPPEGYDKEARLNLQMETVYDWLVWAHSAVQRKREADKAQQGQGQQGQGQQGQKGQSGQTQAGSGSGKGNPGEQEGEQDGQGSGNPSKEDDATEQNGGGSGSEQEESKDEGNDQCDCDADVPSDETQIERIVRTEEAWDLADSLDEIRDLLENGANINDLIAKANGEIDEARGKIQAIIQGLKMQGIGSGNMLLALENDLPEAVIPWDHFLRKTVTRELGTKLDDSYTRFGASTRASLAMRRRAPYQPGTTIFSERPRVLVILDVSGSHISELNQCFAEVWSIAKMKNAAVDVITFDHNVQQKIEIKSKSDFSKLLEDGITGGGGTVMGNVFKEVKEMRTPYRACIIMTDGYLSPPENTEGLKLIWMITQGGTSQGLEDTGEIIHLPDYMGGGIKKAA